MCRMIWQIHYPATQVAAMDTLPMSCMSPVSWNHSLSGWASRILSAVWKQCIELGRDVCVCVCATTTWWHAVHMLTSGSDSSMMLSNMKRASIIFISHLSSLSHLLCWRTNTLSKHYLILLWPLTSNLPSLWRTPPSAECACHCRSSWQRDSEGHSPIHKKTA